MSYSHQGPTLAGRIVLQPGSIFTENKEGFDTGSRVYKTDKANITDPMPAYIPFVGMADDVFPNMYVSDVSMSFGNNEIVTINVSYLGLMRGSQKDPVIEVTTTGNQQNYTNSLGHRKIVHFVEAQYRRVYVIEGDPSDFFPNADVETLLAYVGNNQGLNTLPSFPAYSWKDYYNDDDYDTYVSSWRNSGSGYRTSGPLREVTVAMAWGPKLTLPDLSIS